MVGEPVSPEEVTRALRSVRAAAYRVTATSDGCALALVMNASPAGRRNAAVKIVGLLARHGLALGHEDPAEALTASSAELTVLRGEPGPRPA